MSITGHWKAATGFNTTDYTVTLGKPVADCSDAELAANPMCGSITTYNNLAYVCQNAEMTGSNLESVSGAQFATPVNGRRSELWATNGKPTDDLRRIYRRTIFVASPTGVTLNQYCLKDTTDNRVLIVEDIKDPNKLVIDCGSTPVTIGIENIIWSTSFVCKHTCDRSQTMYSSAPNQVEVIDTTDPDNPVTTYYYIYPVWLYVVADTTFLIRQEYLSECGGFFRGEDPQYEEYNNNYISVNTNFASFSTVTPQYLVLGWNISPTEETSTLLDILGENFYMDPIPDPAVFNPVAHDYVCGNLSTDITLDAPYNIVISMSNSTVGNRARRSLVIFQARDYIWRRLSSYCRIGLYFVYNGELLKPIIKGGIVIGTGTVTDESEIDTYTDLKHPVPSGGGGGGGGTDEDENSPVTTVGAPFATGIANYYAMTAASPLLQHISEAMSTHDIDSDKKDLYRNLISCKLIKPPAPIPTSGSAPFTIYGVKPQYQGSDISLPVVSGNPTASFGPYRINRKFNDFRDYAPYTKCEIFLPYCGWCGLPSHVVGRSVSVQYFTDIIAATCKAVVFCGNNIVAEASGCIGLDIPFASENVGAKMQAANAGLVASTKGALQTAIGVGTLVTTKGQKGVNTVASGLSNYISGFTQMSMAANENWTEINGQTGDGCSLSGASSIIIKITRPKYGSNGESPYVPDGYAHNIGFTSMKGVTVGSVSGLLIADNVDTSNISGATERERAEIKRLLETGIIV